MRNTVLTLFSFTVFWTLCKWPLCKSYVCVRYVDICFVGSCIREWANFPCCLLVHMGLVSQHASWFTLSLSSKWPCGWFSVFFFLWQTFFTWVPVHLCLHFSWAYTWRTSVLCQESPSVRFPSLLDAKWGSSDCSIWGFH